MSVVNVSPIEAYESLASERSSVLVDVRTRAEWSFVGVPDLSEIGKDVILVEWRAFPTMTVNQEFVSQLLGQMADEDTEQAFFICRSGVRSHEAAHAVTDALAATNRHITCVNVAEGFEGDIGVNGHRGEQNGWKARSLPWLQS